MASLAGWEYHMQSLDLPLRELSSVPVEPTGTTYLRLVSRI